MIQQLVKNLCLSLSLLATGAVAAQPVAQSPGGPPAGTNAASQPVLQVTMNQVRLEFSLDSKGTPLYQVSYGNQPVVLPSAMGFTLAGNDNFNSGFSIADSRQDSLNETWTTVWGANSKISNNYRQLSVQLIQAATQRKLNIVFRVFEDGVGFRYEFPRQPQLNHFIISEEHTAFRLTGDHKTFWIPGDHDSNEYTYTTSAISAIDNREMVAKSTEIAVRTAPDPKAVQTPLMMKTADGLYLNIHEAAQLNYPALQLHVDNSSFALTASLVPDTYNNKAYLQAPSRTPWRTILVSRDARAILASNTIVNLNDPSKVEDPSWIKPMKFVGVWWEMQTGVGTWALAGGKHSGNTANVKRYIDFAAANGIEGVLVEGWNTGWEDWFGTWKESPFDFVTPYPDFDVNGLRAYATSKGVQLIMHNETSGAVTNYERQMDTAFRFMQEHGYHAVKTGYVGRIIPRGERHDGQWMVQHYERVAAKAAQYQVMVDMHEPMRPSGQYRTYPNWLASEAARGNEFNAFSIGNPPEHETILPFTRLMGGPMDYTPGIFKLRGYNTGNPGLQVHTTLAKQLALYVTMYSPVQMAADLPENYAPHLDAFQFIREVPVDFERSIILEAEPGDYITIARKSKDKEEWCLGAITDENSRMAIVDLSFLPKGQKFQAVIYGDAANADWKDNPEAYVITRQAVDSKTKLKLVLAKGGGAAVTLRPVTK
ncbi:glycoside hydrolase family 97 protein [Flavihumibacter petaseus]|uniref:Putative glycosidase n=1 Tax=Flavihumibacter petaseus NBRC 106054 TaxID=1220578 RepID=A0A0E9MUL2_9BACT|nr:glycoside hydrolase family 97 protein [Flavihumibacter petaseus]GAO41427.1 putative glycosidase [Flavihumibacter petaseus NBRC 106054]